jgi:hypothetical protein
MGSKKAHLKPDAAKKAREKIRLEKKREAWRKGNEEEEKRRNQIRERVNKSRGAAERRRKAGEKWWEEVGKPKWQAECEEKLRGQMALWAKAKEEDMRQEAKAKEEDMRQEDMRKAKEVKKKRVAEWVREEAYCRGQRDGRWTQGSRAWTHAELGGP